MFNTHPHSRDMPLSGFRVIELGQLVAGPVLGQLLGDLGAEVIKVERPGQGDEYRRYGPTFLKDQSGERTGESGGFLATNRNKRSITVNFAHEKGRQIIYDLAATSDVVIENYRTGALARHGLDEASLRALNPDLIYLSITGFGQDGPYARRPGTDGIFQAMSGFMHATGDPAGLPQKTGTPIADFVTGLYGAIAVLSALLHRERGSGGQGIDLALLDCAIATMAMRSGEHFLGDGITRTGNRTVGVAPGELFPCADGYINIQAGFDHHFKRLCEVIARPELAEDPRFANRDLRVSNEIALAEAIGEALRVDTVARWYEKLASQDIICSPVYDFGQALADPQVKSRKLHRKVVHPKVGEIDIIANPIRFSDTPIADYRCAPSLGEATDDILSNLLGYAPARIAALRQDGAI